MRRTCERFDRQALRRQHVAHLRRPDAERHGAERAVRRRVAVAAGDGHARLRQAELRADDVHDALPVGAEVGEPDAELAAVVLERRHHPLGQLVGEGPALVQRRDDVVDRRVGAFRKRDRDAPPPQHVERLRRSDLVDQVQPDEELRLPGRQASNRMEIPDLLEQGPVHCSDGAAPRTPGVRLRGPLRPAPLPPRRAVRSILQTGLRPEPPASARGDPIAPRRSRRGAPCAPWECVRSTAQPLPPSRSPGGTPRWACGSGRSCRRR